MSRSRQKHSRRGGKIHPKHPLAQLDARLPSYRSAADYLEAKNGAGIRLACWTVARAGLIAVPVRVAGATWKQALFGASLASGLISLLVLARIENEVD